jgi:hypothetical protein
LEDARHWFGDTVVTVWNEEFGGSGHALLFGYLTVGIEMEEGNLVECPVHMFEPLSLEL